MYAAHERPCTSQVPELDAHPTSLTFKDLQSGTRLRLTRMFQSTLMTAEKVCFDRFFFFSFLKTNMNKGQMHFFGNCCSVYVYIWVRPCVSCYFDNGVDLLDFYFSTFRGPPHRKLRAFEFLCCVPTLIRRTGRNKSHTYFKLSRIGVWQKGQETVCLMRGA